VELDHLDLSHIDLSHLEEQLPEIMAKVNAWGELAGVEIPEVHIADVENLSAELRVLLEEQAMPAYEAAIRALGNAQLAGAGGEGDVIIRSYKLPKGKLQGLTKLMSRDDVPVLISPGEKAIEVHGTREQHLIFDAFVKMINGEDQREKYALSKGKLDDLTELMIRSDVPVLVSPGDKAIEVHGTTLEQAVFRAFVNMIDPKATTYEGREPADVREHADARDHEREHARQLERAREHERDARMREYEARARAQRQEMEQLRQVRKQMEREAKRHEQRYREIERRVEDIEREIEHVEREAEEIEDRAEDLDAGERIEAIARVNDLLLRARELENEARIMVAEAEAIEEVIERLEDEADEIEDRLADLEERIEEMMAERGER
jgi:flagellar biosynthesis GTPase FlhF